MRLTSKSAPDTTIMTGFLTDLEMLLASYSRFKGCFQAIHSATLKINID